MKPRAAAVLLLLLLAGCREEKETPPAAAEASCRRVVALAPNLSETLFALGLGDRIVGVGDYSTWPPEAAKLPKLGGLFNPNLERIVSLKPDLAVLLPSQRDLAEKLRRFDVDSVLVGVESLADVERSFHTLARRCGVPEAGDRLASEWKAALAPRPLPGRPRVLLSVGRQAGRLADILVAGPGTFLDEMLARLGAVNAFADAPILYPQVSLEEVVARAPDVILELRAEAVPPEVAQALVRDWQDLPRIPAVQRQRIAVVGGDYVLTPGPRLPRLYAEMRTAIARAGMGPDR